eukprot:3873491-Ditylum_brightwellii.AAC.1
MGLCVHSNKDQIQEQPIREWTRNLATYRTDGNQWKISKAAGLDQSWSWGSENFCSQREQEAGGNPEPCIPMAGLCTYQH